MSSAAGCLRCAVTLPGGVQRWHSWTQFSLLLPVHTWKQHFLVLAAVLSKYKCHCSFSLFLVIIINQIHNTQTRFVLHLSTQRCGAPGHDLLGPHLKLPLFWRRDEQLYRRGFHVNNLENTSCTHAHMFVYRIFFRLLFSSSIAPWATPCILTRQKPLPLCFWRKQPTKVEMDPGDIKTRVNILAKNPYFCPPPPSEIPISSLFFTARFKRRVRNRPKWRAAPEILSISALNESKSR